MHRMSTLRLTAGRKACLLPTEWRSAGDMSAPRSVSAFTERRLSSERARTWAPNAAPSKKDEGNGIVLGKCFASIRIWEIRDDIDHGAHGPERRKRKPAFLEKRCRKCARQDCGSRRNRCHPSRRFLLWTIVPPPVSISTPHAKTETIMTINEAKGMSNENWVGFSCHPVRTFIAHIFACGGKVGKQLIGIGNGSKSKPEAEKPFARLPAAYPKAVIFASGGAETWVGR